MQRIHIILYLALITGFNLTPASATPDKATFSFGIIADTQYADKETNGARHYREALSRLEESVENLNRQELAFTIQLGDIIDGNDTEEKTRGDLQRVLNVFGGLEMPIYHVVGNHCMEAGITNLQEALELDVLYYDFTSPSAPNWRFVVLDGNDAGYGVIGDAQLEWFETALKKAEAAGEKVIVFNHFALIVAAAKNHRMITPEPVLKRISEAGCVMAYFAGHDHQGGYGVHDGIHHVTVKGMVESPTNNAYAVIEVYEDRIIERGYGNEPGRVMTLPQP